jgi:hypothetical protein
MDPPFTNVVVPVNQFEVNGNEDKIIRLKNGSSLSIPKNAFVDKNGKVIEGKINIEYREFSKAADIIASGIPMVYEDENGNTEQMESGGMFELRGKVNNEEVFIAKDKSISVNMSSDIKGEFDFYLLEEEGEKEVPQSQASFLITEAYAQAPSSKSQKVRWKKLTDLVNKKEEEAKVDNNTTGPKFQLKFDTVKFPETKYLSKINFQLATEDFPMNPLAKENNWVTKEKWERLEIRKAELKPKLLKSISYKGKKDSWFHTFSQMLPDSSGIVVNDGKLTLYDFTGKKLSNFGDTSINYIIASPKSDLFLCYSHQENVPGLLYSKEGKLIKNLGSVSNGHFLSGGDRIVYNDKDYSYDELVNYYFIDRNGNLLNKYSTSKGIIGKSDNYIRSWYREMISNDKKYVLILSAPEIKVFDSDGKILNGFSHSEDIIDIGFLNFENCIGFVYKNGMVKIWDWKNNQTISSPYPIMDRGRFYSYIDYGNHPTKPEILLANPSGNGFYIWNWKDNTFKSIATNSKEKVYYNSKHPFIYGSPTGEGLGRPQKIWNDQGKLIAETNDYLEVDYSSDNHVLLLNDNNKVFVKDNNGQELKNFENYDTPSFVDSLLLTTR